MRAFVSACERAKPKTVVVLLIAIVLFIGGVTASFRVLIHRRQLHPPTAVTPLSRTSK